MSFYVVIGREIASSGKGYGRYFASMKRGDELCLFSFGRKHLMITGTR
jgi:hypothetical protein